MVRLPRTNHGGSRVRAKIPRKWQTYNAGYSRFGMDDMISNNKVSLSIMVVIVIAFTSGCATTQNDDAGDPFESANRAHLVCNRADPANPGSDVGNVLEVAAFKEGFKESWRLIDVDFNFFGLAVLIADI